MSSSFVLLIVISIEASSLFLCLSKLTTILLPITSNDLPARIVRRSPFGVCFILSSPMNSKAEFAYSYKAIRPCGRGMLRLLSSVFLFEILFPVALLSVFFLHFEKHKFLNI